MKLPTALFVLLYLKCALGNSTAPPDSDRVDMEEMEYSEGTSVEAKYLLPPVNVSVSENATTYTVRASLARVLDFYNTELLAANWDRFKDTLSEGCRKDVDTYIQGLSRAENWALKSRYWGGGYDDLSPLSQTNFVKKREKYVACLKYQNMHILPLQYCVFTNTYVQICTSFYLKSINKSKAKIPYRYKICLKNE